MREIKFKCWDKEKNKMSFWENIYQTNDFWDDAHYPETLPVMQYTGLKDNNGKEIFEGDIIKHENGQISVVEWSDGDWGWWMKSIKNWDPKTGFDSSKDKIIGNIYEDKEIIK